MAINGLIELLLPNAKDNRLKIESKLKEIESIQKEAENSEKIIDETTSHFRKVRACLNGEDCWMTNEE